MVAKTAATSNIRPHRGAKTLQTIQKISAPRRLDCHQTKRRRVTRCSTGPQDEGTRLLEEDMKRYSRRDRENQGERLEQVQEVEDIGGGAKELLDKVLIGDFFFVLLALAWLALGVVEKTTLSTSRLLDVWFPLWTLIFQPAIGVLMLGALASGGLGWLRSKKS